jgi:hypothetical protein
MLWSEFEEEMKESLGDTSTRDGDTYNRWMRATWKNGSNASVTYEYIKGLEALLPDAPTEDMTFYHFWNLTPAVYEERLSGAANPLTRRELVTAINQLCIDLGQNKRPARDEDEDSKRGRYGNDSQSSGSGRRD